MSESLRGTETNTGQGSALTREDLVRATERMREMDEAATRRTAAIAESIATLDLDTAAMSYHELSLLSLAYQGHIFHPADYKKLQAAIERTRRDR